MIIERETILVYSFLFVFQAVRSGSSNFAVYSLRAKYRVLLRTLYENAIRWFCSHDFNTGLLLSFSLLPLNNESV